MKKCLMFVLSLVVFSAEADPTLKELKTYLVGKAKPTYLPMEEDGEAGRTATKYGGLFYTDEKNPWPMCKACDEPMLPALQLNLAELPAKFGKFPGEGLAQLFVCTRTPDEGDCCLQLMAEGGTACARLITELAEPTDVSEDVLAALEGMGEAEVVGNYIIADTWPVFERKVIGDWMQLRDVPHKDEWDAPYKSIDTVALLGEDPGPWDREKFMGYANWPKASNLLTCDVCQKPMVLLFQFRMDHHLEFYEFGKPTRMQWQCCPDHPEQMGSTWHAEKTEG